jgi:hypothetical protein
MNKRSNGAEAVCPMKRKTGAYGFIMFLALAMTAQAGEIAGKWVVTAENVDIEMDFKVDGNTLTGAIYNPFSGEMKLREGKVKGDNFSFIAIRKIGQNEMRILWKGVLDGDVIRFTRVFPGGKATQLIGLRPKGRD